MRFVDILDDFDATGKAFNGRVPRLLASANDIVREWSWDETES